MAKGKLKPVIKPQADVSGVVISTAEDQSVVLHNLPGAEPIDGEVMLPAVVRDRRVLDQEAVRIEKERLHKVLAEDLAHHNIELSDDRIGRAVESIQFIRKKQDEETAVYVAQAKELYHLFQTVGANAYHVIARERSPYWRASATKMSMLKAVGEALAAKKITEEELPSSLRLTYDLVRLPEPLYAKARSDKIISRDITDKPFRDWLSENRKVVIAQRPESPETITAEITRLENRKDAIMDEAVQRCADIDIEIKKLRAKRAEMKAALSAAEEFDDSDSDGVEGEGEEPEVPVIISDPQDRRAVA